MSDNITDKPDEFCRTQIILILTPSPLVFDLSIHNVWSQDAGFVRKKDNFSWTLSDDQRLFAALRISNRPSQISLYEGYSNLAYDENTAGGRVDHA